MESAKTQIEKHRGSISGPQPVDVDADNRKSQSTRGNSEAPTTTASVEIRRQNQKEEEKNNETNNANREGSAKKAPKKTRRKYTYSYDEPEVIGEDGNPVKRPKVITARDLAKLIPVNKAVYVVCNPDKAICTVKDKRPNGIKQVETVAKPRRNFSNNTLILTSKFQEGEDVDRILEEFKEFQQ
ncbi:hypothetical protein CAEBREN_23581 [Caenorhabditis brenneri]|uniref:Uncharacterized protein n=1 Tax=Caenorhabditis brenneri TaxID=135651 RepID=G0MY13_CAEBE|nr:hypothetical protein CAEBREN_23581 [Caenorhabditis brenneri]